MQLKKYYEEVVSKQNLKELINDPKRNELMRI